MQLLTYDFINIGESIQEGDTGYYTSNVTTQGGFQVGLMQWQSGTWSADIIEFGTVTNIDRDSSPKTVTFMYDNNSNITAPAQGDYIMFGKDNRANSSSLLGYYAEVKFVNNSHEKAELFSVGSETSESSK